MNVYAPGKLILSGEHAVVHGAPALAMAVQCHAKTTISYDVGSRIRIDLENLPHRTHTTLSKLRKLKHKIKNKYKRFVQGDFTIRDVLREPYELAQFALGILTDSFNVRLPHGVNISIHSDIPIGCGMGSSAATILSMMYAVKQYLKLPLSPEKLFEMALQAENLQHGRSSGLDLHVIQHGGCVYTENGEYHHRPMPSLPLFLVNTGSPKSSTGECVEMARQVLMSDGVLEEFKAITQNMDQALQNNDEAALRQSIKQNHALLVRLGVVPNRVQRFIETVEANGGAAKICGAGSVSGDHAGMVLVSMDNALELQRLSQRYGYQLIPLKGDERGVYAV